MKKNSTPALDTKSYILAKSLPHFVNHGAHGLTLSDLSRALKMSKPALLYHFKKPQDIFLALMDKWAESGTKFTNAYIGKYFGHGPDVIIRGIMEATLEWLETDEPFARLTLAVFLAAQSDKTIQNKLDLLFGGGRGRIAGLLKLSPRKYKEADLEKMAIHIHTQIVGALIYEMILNEKLVDKKSYRLTEINNFKKTLTNYF